MLILGIMDSQTAGGICNYPLPLFPRRAPQRRSTHCLGLRFRKTTSLGNSSKIFTGHEFGVWSAENRNLRRLVATLEVEMIGLADFVAVHCSHASFSIWESNVGSNH
jgi:hypothetical protein